MEEREEEGEQLFVAFVCQVFNGEIMKRNEERERQRQRKRAERRKSPFDVRVL